MSSFTRRNVSLVWLVNLKIILEEIIHLTYWKECWKYYWQWKCEWKDFKTSDLTHANLKKIVTFSNCFFVSRRQILKLMVNVGNLTHWWLNHRIVLTFTLLRIMFKYNSIDTPTFTALSSSHRTTSDALTRSRVTPIGPVEVRQRGVRLSMPDNNNRPFSVS